MDSEKVALLTRPTQARRDAPLPMLRSRLIEILNVPHSGNRGVLAARGRAGEKGYASGFDSPAALLTAILSIL